MSVGAGDPLLRVVALKVLAFALSSVTTSAVAGRSTRDRIAPVSESGIGPAPEYRPEERGDAAVGRRRHRRLRADVGADALVRAAAGDVDVSAARAARRQRRI